MVRNGGLELVYLEMIMKNKSECKTLVRIEGDNQIFKDKKKFIQKDKKHIP